MLPPLIEKLRPVSRNEKGPEVHAEPEKAKGRAAQEALVIEAEDTQAGPVSGLGWLAQCAQAGTPPPLQEPGGS